MKKKLKGFTLSEILVSLAISSLVILAAVSIYYITLKSAGNFNFRRTNNTEFLNFLYRFENDFEECQTITLQHNKLIIKCENDSTNYQFSETNVIISKKNIVDTINVQIIEIKYYLDSNLVENGLINAITITFLFEGRNKEVLINKKYDACNYLVN